MPKEVVKCHRFSEDIIGRVRQCYKTDNYHGPMEIFEDWATIAIAIDFSAYAFRQFSRIEGLLIYFVAILLIGGRQRALADILHQASHGTLVINRKIGIVLGTVFSGYTIFQSFSGYWHSHVYSHHGSFGDPSRDPDYLQYQRLGLCGNNMTRRRLSRYLLSICMPRATVSYVLYLVRDRIWNRNETSHERMARFCYYGLVLAALTYLGYLQGFLIYWIIPLVTTQTWIGSLLELTEHYPMIDQAPQIDIYMSRNRECGYFGNFLLGIQPDEGYHLVHHKFPKVPLWRYREVHRILMQDPVYASLHKSKGWPSLLRSMIAHTPDNPLIHSLGLPAGEQ